MISRQPSTLSFDEMLARMYASDASANGLFVTGVAVADLNRDPLTIPDVQALARRVGVGISKLHLLVQRHFQMTPAELIHKNRIETAKRLLQSGESGTVDAAFAVGYESVSAFYNRFKRATGFTPGAFARRHTPGPTP